MKTEEIWKDYENELLHESQKFRISNYGRVQSLNKAKPTILKGYINNGYLTFSTRKKNNKRTLIYVHKAVAETFVTKDKERNLVIHKDFDKLNNRADNLAWATSKEAEDHANNNPKGAKIDKIRAYWDNAEGRERVSANKLKETQVLKLRKMVTDPNRKTRMRIIAKQFGVSVEQAYRIKNGECWGWLTEDYLKNEKSDGLGKEFLKKLKNEK